MQKVTKKHINQIIKYYNRGWSASKIRKKIKLSVCTIFRYLRMNNINIRKTSKIPKYYINELFFEKIDNERKAYWLGFFYADGNVSIGKRGHTVTLSLNPTDKKHIQTFQKNIETNTPIYYAKASNTSNIRICNKKIAYDLNNLGCIPRKSLILKFPTPKQVPNNLIHHFIRGYFDGDGCIHKIKTEKNIFHISIMSSTQFCKGLRNFLIKKLNIRINIRNPKNYKPETSVITIYSREGCYKMKKFLYRNATVFLNRKYKIFKKVKKFKKRAIYKFWDIDGKYIEIKNINEFCKENPIYTSGGFYNLHKGIARQYKGWTKYKNSQNWKRVKLIKRPSTGRNYNFKDLI